MEYSIICYPDKQREIFGDSWSLYLHQHNSKMQIEIIHTYDD
jgi:hypothetical protein